MDKFNRVIKTPDELATVMQAFKMAPDNEIGEFIVGQTDKIIDLDRRNKFLEEVIDIQKNQLERRQKRACDNQARRH